MSDFNDLVYVEPPSHSNAHYNIHFKTSISEYLRAHIVAIEDGRRWDDRPELAFDDVKKALTIVRTMRSAIDETDIVPLSGDSVRPNCRTAPRFEDQGLHLFAWVHLQQVNRELMGRGAR